MDPAPRLIQVFGTKNYDLMGEQWRPRRGVHLFRGDLSSNVARRSAVRRAVRYVMGNPTETATIFVSNLYENQEVIYIERVNNTLILFADDEHSLGWDLGHWASQALADRPQFDYQIYPLRELER